MTRTNFPGGFPFGVSVSGLPINIPTPGNVYWVDSGDANAANANDGTATYPLATIDGAINKCTASQGDIIFVKAGHAETLSDATSLNADVAGVKIIGLGEGSDRPTITLDTATTATIPVSAANVSFSNFIFSINFADVVAVFTLTTAKNFKVVDCDVLPLAVDMDVTRVVDTSTTDNAADGLTLIGVKWIDVDASTETLVDVDADLEGLTIHDCYIDLGVNGVLSTLAEVAAGKDLTNLDIRRNYSSRLVTASAVQLITFVDTTTTNTGIMESNRCRSLDVAGEIIVTAGSNISFYDNLTTSAIDKSGYILPVIDA